MIKRSTMITFPVSSHGYAVTQTLGIHTVVELDRFKSHFKGLFSYVLTAFQSI